MTQFQRPQACSRTAQQPLLPPHRRSPWCFLGTNPNEKPMGKGGPLRQWRQGALTLDTGQRRAEMRLAVKGEQP